MQPCRGIGDGLFQDDFTLCTNAKLMPTWVKNVQVYIKEDITVKSAGMSVSMQRSSDNLNDVFHSKRYSNTL